MVRPNKEGLDYFPHDVDMSMDDKIQLLEAEHGLLGYGIVNKLLERIYRNGYYLPFNEKIMKIFCRAVNIKIETCKTILDTCLDEKIFSKKLFKEYDILTSKGIQNRFLEAIKRRKSIKMLQEYLLVGVNGDDNSINVDIISINTGSNPQRKEKKRKEKKRKNTYMENVTLSQDEYEKLVEQFGEEGTLKGIEILNNYKMSTGKTYKSDYHAFLNWVKDKKEVKLHGKKSRDRGDDNAFMRGLRERSDEYVD